MALNELIGGARVSRDIDLFHGTEAAVAAAWAADHAVLATNKVLALIGRSTAGSRADS